GATFSTEDEPFVTSSNSDTHPTDVLQDADGSLLVVITGGWFIEGCPLSRVAKPDVPGGIYRIRKTGAREIEDPRGLSVNMDELSAEDLVDYLSDHRFAVRDRSIEALVQKGEGAVEQLNKALTSEEEEIRTAALFVLYRIDSEGTAKTIISTLADQSQMVRTAAVRVLGLMKEKAAIDPLVDLVKNDEPSVKRQAATALGQIGDKR